MVRRAGPDPHHAITPSLKLVWYDTYFDVIAIAGKMLEYGFNVGRPLAIQREERKDADFSCYATKLSDRVSVKIERQLVRI